MQAQGYGMGGLATLVGPVVNSLSYSTFTASHLDAGGCHTGAIVEPPCGRCQLGKPSTPMLQRPKAKGSCDGMLTPHPVGLKTTPCRQRSH